MKTHRRLFTLFMSLLVLALLASVSFAGPGALEGPGGSRDVVTTEDTE